MPAVSDPQNPATAIASTPQPAERKTPGLSMLRRAAFGLCGVVLVLGFFLPWVTAGTAIELSGLSLAFSGGEAVKAIAGSGSFLLFLVPLLGGCLIAGAATAHRFTPWVGTVGAGALLVYGFYHVISLFLASTGIGMWLVVFAALFTLVIGSFSMGRN